MPRTRRRPVGRCSTRSSSRSPPLARDADAPLQALVTNLDASDYLGRLAVGRVHTGYCAAAVICRPARRGDLRGPAARSSAALSQLLASRASAASRSTSARRRPVRRSPGSRRSRSATRSPASSTRAPPAAGRRRAGAADDSSRVNTSPLAGKDGKYLTSPPPHRPAQQGAARQRLDPLYSTDSPDVIEVAGRGELQLAVLIESMRREGYELQVSRPEVITKEVERQALRAPGAGRRATCPTSTSAPSPRSSRPERAGSSTCAPATPDGRSSPSSRPSRGLIGFRSLLLDRDAGHRPAPPAPRRVDAVGGRDARTGRAAPCWPTGSGTVDRLRARQAPARGASSSSAPASTLYEGMVVGECARHDDMVVNVVRPKQKNNIRTHSHDERHQAGHAPGPHAGERRSNGSPTTSWSR